MAKIANNLTELIGSTPLLRLSRFGADAGAEVVAKLEAFNPGGSVKGRIAGRQIARRPENKGKLIVVILPDTGERYLSTACFRRYETTMPFYPV